MSDTDRTASSATLVLDSQPPELPVVTGSEGERAINIRALRAGTGHVTLDPGFGKTASCASAITFVDGEKGILRYRGIPIEQFADAPHFLLLGIVLG